MRPARRPSSPVGCAPGVESQGRDIATDSGGVPPLRESYCHNAHDVQRSQFWSTAWSSARPAADEAEARWRSTLVLGPIQMAPAPNTATALVDHPG